MPNWGRNKQDVREGVGDMSPGLRLLLFAGVFFMFAPIMVLGVSRLDPQRPWYIVGFWFVISGLVAVVWVTVAVRWRRWLPLVSVLQVGVVLVFARQWPPGLGIGRPRVGVESLVIIACIAAGYILLVRFIREQARQSVRMQTELDLASQIHRTLVPPIEVRSAGVEVFGRSHASNEMGGDLIDVTVRGGRVDAFLADVSGHGVGAGIVMAMVKSAIRMRMRSDPPLAELVTDLNSVLTELTSSDMFATFACVRVGADRKAEFALAGHLPILHFVSASGELRELPNDHLPLGISSEESFHSGAATMTAGDTLAVFTDGLSEVQDAQGRELGLSKLRDVFRDAARRPLAEIAEALVGAARDHGAQRDDQSVLLLRVM